MDLETNSEPKLHAASRRPPRIKRLSEQVINEIAAGEVVDRPSSVVKELVENSLDAGSSRIEVHLTGGGLEGIQIIDNGMGMGEEDLLLSVERHATSKLTAVTDLDSIQSYGFRGEALASIAAVGRVEVRTRTSEMSYAHSLTVDFGKMDSEIKRVSGPVGTSITVTGLFLKIPARLKFMKSAATELSHCTRILRELALGNPSVAFSLTHGGRTLLSFSPSDRLKRFQEVFRPPWEPLLVKDCLESISMEAYLSPPGLSQDRSEIWIYVNRRPVRHKVILTAVRNAYAQLLGPHHEPSGTLYLEVREDWVDVNVHPQKLDVRLFRQEALYQWIAGTIKKMVKANAPAEVIQAPPLEKQFGVNAVISEGRYRYHCQIDNSYLLCQDDRGLVLVDQQRLDERRIGRGMENSPAGRPLEKPRIVLVPEECTHLETLLPFLKGLGIELEWIGDREMAVKSWTELSDPARLDNVLLELMLAPPDHYKSVFTKHSARPRKERLSESEALALLSELATLDDAATCPHGRPVFFRITLDEIRKHLEPC